MKKTKQGLTEYLAEQLQTANQQTRARVMEVISKNLPTLRKMREQEIQQLLNKCNDDLRSAPDTGENPLG